MKTDDEVQESIKRNTKLLRETLDLFHRCFRTYAGSVSEEMLECAEKLRKNGLNLDARQRLTALVRDLQDTAASFNRHVIQMNREMKVINHKNEVRANDRLFVALDRMKRDTMAWQEKLDALAKAKRAKAVGR